MANEWSGAGGASSVTVDGLSDLHKLMQELPAKLEANIMRGGMRAGAKVIEEEAKRLVPEKDGDLRKSIRVSVRLFRGRVSATIKAGGGKAFYAHMVERGTVRHYIRVKNYKGSVNTLNKAAKRGGLNIGGRFVGSEVIHPGSKKKPFMRPAMDRKWRDAVEVMGEYIRNRLPKEFRKLK